MAAASVATVKLGMAAATAATAAACRLIFGISSGGRRRRRLVLGVMMGVGRTTATTTDTAAGRPFVLVDDGSCGRFLGLEFCSGLRPLLLLTDAAAAVAAGFFSALFQFS